MRMNRLLATGFAAAIIGIALPLHAPAQAQSPTPPAEKCLRALDGSCTNPAMVEAARLRAIIIPSVRVSYYGTPAGTIGGDYIPFERLFRDNDVLWGLPTSTFFCCNRFQRTK
jgi:hypothetical protein